MSRSIINVIIPGLTRRFINYHARLSLRRWNVLPKKSLEIGDLVTLLIKDWNGLAGIVSQPITVDHPGHVLVHKEGCIFGGTVTIQDVVLAETNSVGFAQLAYNLLQLGSRVIEARLIV